MFPCRGLSLLPPLLTLLCPAVLTSISPSELTKPSHQSDFDFVTRFFAGTYDNYVQFVTDILSNEPENLRHKHLLTIVVEEQVPVLGDETRNFYLEQSLNGDPTDVIRQALYSFSPANDGGVDLQFYSFKEPQRVLHARANSSVFLTLTSKDLQLNQGCDQRWTRVNGFFKSSMGNTCFVVFNGLKVMIIANVTFSSAYLTVDERYTLQNKTVIMSYPSPYNMTKMVSEVNHNRRLIAPVVSRHRTTVNTFVDLVNTLDQGIPVRYAIQTNSCKVTTGVKAEVAALMGGYIDTYEYFNDSRFGPDEYFAFTTSTFEANSTGGLVLQLREFRTYSDRVTVTVTQLTPDVNFVYWKFMLTCSAFTSGMSAEFFQEAAEPPPMLVNFQSLMAALKSGATVRFAADYSLCRGLGVNARSGGIINDFQVLGDSTHAQVTFGLEKLITNYQGPGYVRDIVLVNISQNGTATFTASDRQASTFKPVYIETFYCEMTGPGQKGGMHYYRVYG